VAADPRPSEQSSQLPTPGHGAGLQAGPQAVDTASCDGGAGRGGANGGGGGGAEERAGGGSNGGTNSGGDGTDPKGGGGGGGDAGGGSESGGGGANGKRSLHVSYRQVGSAVVGYRQPPGQES